MDNWWDRQELIPVKAENILNAQPAINWPFYGQNIDELEENFPRVQCL